jgi:uncharacterized protein (DUF2235 family)
VAKNILIFSDGTGQAGGVTFDENRTNIYKLFRATRCGPDSSIDPSEQVAFYDPELGSPRDDHFTFGWIGRKLYNLISQGTGFRITANIIDCYAALIRLWQPGDRIYLFGFSRGAYTVRCLAAVITYCGIPTKLPYGEPVKLDVASSKKLASYAVKHSSRPRHSTTRRIPGYISAACEDDRQSCCNDEFFHCATLLSDRSFSLPHVGQHPMARCVRHFFGGMITFRIAVSAFRAWVDLTPPI